MTFFACGSIAATHRLTDRMTDKPTWLATWNWLLVFHRFSCRSLAQKPAKNVWADNVGWQLILYTSNPVRVKLSISVHAEWCLHGTAPSYLAGNLLQTSYVDTRRRLRSADIAMLLVPSTRRSTLGDRAFPVASARAWNILPSSVSNAPSLTTFRRELKTTFSIVVWRLGDRDCTAQYNCCLPATTDCRRFWHFSVLFVLFNFVRCPCNVFDMIVSL